MRGRGGESGDAELCRIMGRAGQRAQTEIIDIEPREREERARGERWAREMLDARGGSASEGHGRHGKHMRPLLGLLTQPERMPIALTEICAPYALLPRAPRATSHARGQRLQCYLSSGPAVRQHQPLERPPDS